jgi:hypothetical protein
MSRWIAISLGTIASLQACSGPIARPAPAGEIAASPLRFVSRPLVGHSEQERAANRKAELVRISKWAGCEPPASFDFR